MTVAAGWAPYLGELAVWTLAVVPHSAAVMVVEVVGSAVIQKAVGFVAASSSAAAAAAIAANLQQPLLVGFVVVVNSDAAPLTVAAGVLQLSY